MTQLEITHEADATSTPAHERTPRPAQGQAQGQAPPAAGKSAVVTGSARIAVRLDRFAEQAREFGMVFLGEIERPA
jgi:hypothetical protein